MKNENKTFTLIECLMVVAILLLVGAIAIKDLVHSVAMSEENTIHAATTQYTEVRNMYAEHYRAEATSASGGNVTSVASVFNSPAH
jgi:prepilin-type N-terminal cleavage/methylation domain-containing protein